MREHEIIVIGTTTTISVSISSNRALIRKSQNQEHHAGEKVIHDSYKYRTYHIPLYFPEIHHDTHAKKQCDFRPLKSRAKWDRHSQTFFLPRPDAQTGSIMTSLSSPWSCNIILPLVLCSIVMKSWLLLVEQQENIIGVDSRCPPNSWIMPLLLFSSSLLHY